MKKGTVRVKVTYKLSENINPMLDQTIRNKMKTINGDWYAQGYNIDTGIRDICFDLAI